MNEKEKKVADAVMRGRADLGAQEPDPWPRAITHIVELKESLEHATVCDYPDSVRFRCDDCTEAENLLRKY